MQWPAFASVCLVLRYVKRFVVMSPAPAEQLDTAPPPVLTVDYLQRQINATVDSHVKLKRNEGV